MSKSDDPKQMTAQELSDAIFYAQAYTGAPIDTDARTRPYIEELVERAERAATVHPATTAGELKLTATDGEAERLVSNLSRWGETGGDDSGRDADESALLAYIHGLEQRAERAEAETKKAVTDMEDMACDLHGRIHEADVRAERAETLAGLAVELARLIHTGSWADIGKIVDLIEAAAKGEANGEKK